MFGIHWPWLSLVSAKEEDAQSLWQKRDRKNVLAWSEMAFACRAGHSDATPSAAQVNSKSLVKGLYAPAANHDLLRSRKQRYASIIALCKLPSPSLISSLVEEASNRKPRNLCQIVTSAQHWCMRFLLTFSLHLCYNGFFTTEERNLFMGRTAYIVKGSTWRPMYAEIIERSLYELLLKDLAESTDLLPSMLSSLITYIFWAWM